MRGARIAIRTCSLGHVVRALQACSGAASRGLNGFSQVDVLVSWYKFVNFGGGEDYIDRESARRCAPEACSTNTLGRVAILNTHPLPFLRVSWLAAQRADITDSSECQQNRSLSTHPSSDAVGRVLLALDAARPTPGIEPPTLVPRLVAQAAHWAMMPLAAAEVLAPLARAGGTAVPDSGFRVQGLGFMVWGLGLGFRV